ncbi:MAG: HlyC/CorC family transporter [Spirochaetales bacterium]|nr:HlyC/CorC family transporter [Spirochaetales bacterium]
MEEGNIIDFLVSLILLVLFMILSSFFSGTETAFFSLNSLEREKLRGIKGKWNKSVIELFFSSPDRILVTILTGNMIVNIFATDIFALSFSEMIVERIPFMDSELFSVVVMTLIILLFGEMTPKNLAIRHPLAFAQSSLIPLSFFTKLFLPLTCIFNFMRSKILMSLPAKNSQDDTKKKALIGFAMKVGFQGGLITKYELDILESYLDFIDKTAADVMIPRTEIRGIDISTEIGHIFSLISEGKAKLDGSFLYVYQNDFDHPVGYIEIKDLLPLKYNVYPDEGGAVLKSIVRPYYSVPGSKNLGELTRELRHSNSAVALVIDEFGGTSGIVTFKTIVQDLLDYFYSSEKDSILRIGDDLFSIPGSIEIETLENFFGVSFPSESRTISGMIIEKLGEIPEQGVSLDVSGIRFTVRKAGKNRIVRLEAGKGKEA